MVPDLLSADPVGFLFLALILLLMLNVRLSGHANHRPKRLHHLTVLNLPRRKHNSSALHAPGGLNDGVTTLLEFHVLRIEIVDLSPISKPDSNNFYHIAYSYQSRSRDLYFTSSPPVSTPVL